MGRPKKTDAEKAASAKARAAAEKAKPSEVRESISKSKLRALLNSARRTKENVDKLVGDHRSELAVAVEKNHLDKEVFALIKKLDRKEAERLGEWRSTFFHYWNISGLEDRARSAPTLQFEEVDDSPDRKNVSDFPQPRAQAAE